MKRKERGLFSLILTLVLVFNIIIFDCYLAADTVYASEPDTTLPDEVTNLRGDDIGYDYIRIAWDAATDDSGTVSYVVYKDGSEVINTDLLFYQDNDLDSGTSFEYGIKAIDPSGNTSDMVSIILSTLSLPVPTGINTTAADTSISVAWNSVTDATGYDIEVDGVVVDNGNGTSYQHTGLEPGTEHTYRVRAKNESTTSDWSALVSETTTSSSSLDIPTNINSTAEDISITITWDVASGTGEVQKITDQAGREITVSYNGQGFISTITDPMNRTVNYEYANNLLVRATDPTGCITRYGYDAQGYLNEIRDHDNNLLETIVYNHSAGENQHKVSQTTDEFGNVHSYAYNNTSRKTTITDSNGRTIIKWYDNYMYIVKSQDPEGRQTTVEYYTDAEGVNKYGEEKSVTDRNGNKTQYIRDDRGNVIKEINPDASYKEFAYDEKNNLTMEKDEQGKHTFYIYDAEKINLIKKAQPLNGTDQYYQVGNRSRTGWKDNSLCL